MTSRPAARPRDGTRRARPWSSGIRSTWSGAVLGLSVFGIGFLIAQRGQLSVFERDVFRVVNDLPAIVFPIVWTVMQLGNVIAVPVLAGAAALAGRFRMARDMLVSGLLAYLAAAGVKSVVGRERPGGLSTPTCSTATSAASASSPGTPPSRRRRDRGGALPLPARSPRRLDARLGGRAGPCYVGAHLPLDVVGGMAVGWALGSLVHYVFGVPRWEPEPDAVARMLHRFGLRVHDVRPAAVEPAARTPSRPTTTTTTGGST